MDQNIKTGQNLVTLPIAIVVMIARSNRTADLRPLIPDVERVLSTLKPCSLVEIDASHSITIVAPGK